MDEVRHNAPQWFTATISVPDNVEEEISCALMELGAAGVELRDQQTMERPEDEGRSCVVAYFQRDALENMEGEDITRDGQVSCPAPSAQTGGQEGGRDLQVLHWQEKLESALSPFRPALCRGDSGGTPQPPIILSPLPDPGWIDKWKEFYSVTSVSNRITIAPVWEEYTPQRAEEIVIRLDPGQAFGTGRHATTTLCLQAIDSLHHNRECRLDRVLDVGSGSGVLAIAAALLGAREVLALDNDHLSVEAVRLNAASNNVADRIQAGLLVAEHNTPPMEHTYDLVLANIQADVLSRIGDFLVRSTSPGGVLILSGVLEPEAETITNIYTSLGMILRQSLRGGDDANWTALVFVREAS